MSATDNLDQDLLAIMTQDEIDSMNAEDVPGDSLIMRTGHDDEDDDKDDGDNGDQETEALKDEVQEQRNDDAPYDAPIEKGYQAKLPDDYQSQIDAIKADSEALAQSFKDGTIDFDEYIDESKNLSDAKESLLKASIKAEISQEMQVQTAEQEWVSTVKRFTSQVAKDEGIDYAKDAAKQKDLDLFIKALAGDAENDNKPMSWFLEEAHRRVVVLHGITAKPAVENKKQSRKPPVNDLPKSLANIPAGEGPGDIGHNEFDALDKLDGLELEIAIAKMTPDQRERYLRA